MADLDDFFAKKSKKKKTKGERTAKPEKKKEEKELQLATSTEVSRPLRSNC